MSTSRCCAIVVLSFVSFAVGQQAASVPAKALSIEQGALANGVYSNECLGFSFPIPAGWQINYQVVGSDLKAKHLPDRGLALLMIDQPQATGITNRIVLEARDAAGGGLSTQEDVSSSARRFVALHPEGREVVRDAYAVNYGGRQFFRVDYKQSTSFSTIYLALIFTQFRGYLMGENLTARSPKELDQEADALLGVTFQDDRVNPRCALGTEEAPNQGGVIFGTLSAKPVVRPGSTQRIRVSQKVSQSLLVKSVDPKYPEDARQARIQGVVVLQAYIDKDGNVENLTLISGDPALAQAAIDAVKQWKYKSYLLNGQPLPVATQVNVNFSLAEQ